MEVDCSVVSSAVSPRAKVAADATPFAVAALLSALSTEDCCSNDAAAVATVVATAEVAAAALAAAPVRMPFSLPPACLLASAAFFLLVASLLVLLESDFAAGAEVVEADLTPADDLAEDTVDLTLDPDTDFDLMAMFLSFFPSFATAPWFLLSLACFSSPDLCLTLLGFSSFSSSPFSLETCFFTLPLDFLESVSVLLLVAALLASAFSFRSLLDSDAALRSSRRPW